MKKYILIGVVVLSLIACILLINFQADTRIIYEGGSQNWIVTYTIEGNKQNHDSNYTIKYIGDQSNNVKNVYYKIDGPTEGEDGYFILPDTKEYSSELKDTGGIPGSSDRDIRFNIEWNDQKEHFMLERKN